MVVRSISAGLVIIAVIVDGVWAKPPVEQNQKREAEAITIPLERIWAYNMPGTRDIRTLEPNVFSEHTMTVSEADRQRQYNQSLVNQIGGELRHLPPKTNQVAEPGFVVAGTDLGSLRAAGEVLVKKNKRQHELPVGSTIWIVFFSRQCDRYVHVVQVERNGDVIEVQFRFVPHRTKEITAHFAIIPLGKLPGGRYHVNVVRSEIKPNAATWHLPELAADQMRRIVCQSFSFTMTE
jgi:hypothetical protein